MCVRYSVVAPGEGEARQEALRDRFPGDLGEIVAPGGEVVEARWGLQPAWAEDPNFGKKSAYNARAETVAEKPTFRSAFRHRRCVVPAAAFYERAPSPSGGWRWLRVCPREGDAFAIAGLWEEGEERSFTMVTTEPNRVVGELHDRMPALLSPEDAAAWMDPEADLRELRALLVACPPEWTSVEDAGPVGGRRKAEGPSLFDA